MTEVIAATGGRYQRHNAHDAKTDREVAKLAARSSNKVVACAQTGKKQRSEKALGNEKENKNPAPTDNAVISKRYKTTGGGNNENADKLSEDMAAEDNEGKTTSVQDRRKTTQPK